MADADVDGSHILTLLLTFFYRYFPEIIKQGYLYIAQAPLYKLEKGKEIKYVYSEKGKEETLKKWGLSLDKEKNKEKINIQRYKGLGEMNPEELFSTTMDIEKRSLKKVIIDEVEKVDEIFEILMGKEVEPRKKFIQTHAKAVRNLDI